MTQQRLNGSQIHPGFQKMSSKTVPERMNPVPFFNAGPKLRPIVGFLGVVDRDRSALSIGKQISRRAMLPPIGAQFTEQPLG